MFSVLVQIRGLLHWNDGVEGEVGVGGVVDEGVGMAFGAVVDVTGVYGEAFAVADDIAAAAGEEHDLAAVLVRVQTYGSTGNQPAFRDTVEAVLKPAGCVILFSSLEIRDASLFYFAEIYIHDWMDLGLDG
jgi:hypothetical protein